MEVLSNTVEINKKKDQKSNVLSSAQQATIKAGV